jgi:hypothetical protein
MASRFFTANGRYQSISYSRYRHHTEGENKIQEVEGDPEAAQHGTYGPLLFDKRWIAKRTEILTRDNHRCVICGNGEKLQVHHRQYHFIKALKKFKPPWDYEDFLMISLCDSCHSRGHSKFKVPTLYL